MLGLNSCSCICMFVVVLEFVLWLKHLCCGPCSFCGVWICVFQSKLWCGSCICKHAVAQTFILWRLHSWFLLLHTCFWHLHSCCGIGIHNFAFFIRVCGVCILLEALEFMLWLFWPLCNSRLLEVKVGKKSTWDDAEKPWERFYGLTWLNLLIRISSSLLFIGPEKFLPADVCLLVLSKPISPSQPRILKSRINSRRSRG